MAAGQKTGGGRRCLAVAGAGGVHCWEAASPAASPTHLGAGMVPAVCEVQVGSSAEVVCMDQFMHDRQLHLSFVLQLVVAEDHLRGSTDKPGGWGGGGARQAMAPARCCWLRALVPAGDQVLSASQRARQEVAAAGGLVACLTCGLQVGVARRSDPGAGAPRQQRAQRQRTTRLLRALWGCGPHPKVC